MHNDGSGRKKTKGRPRKTWWNVIKKDVKNRFGLPQEDLHSQRKWKKKIKGYPANLGSPGRRQLN